MYDVGNTDASSVGDRPITAVVPAAGLGTRLRPLSDAIPKEMLPVGRQPVLEHIVLELEAAGIRHIVVILSPAKEERIRSYFGKQRGAIEFTYIVQPQMLGLGDAVLRAEGIVREAFVIALGDAVFEETAPGGVTRRLIDAFIETGSGVGLAVQRVAPENISRYGVVRPSAPTVQGAALVPISDIIEKPAIQEAPSDLAAAARYVVTCDVFDALRATPPDARGELQLTHALQRLLRQGHHGVAVPLRSEEKRHDIGAFDSYFRAFLRFALADSEYGNEFRRSATAILGETGQEDTAKR
jgi:UTP--glucose-1-phosphate uridylyltransferase